MALKAKHWGGIVRINEAANLPYHSLHPGAWNENDAYAVSALQFALKKIELASPRLILKHRPTGFYFKGGQWGHFGFDPDKIATYDVYTELAVRHFQDQASLTVDGLAGMETFHRLDGILVAVERLPPIGPPAP